MQKSKKRNSHQMSGLFLTSIIFVIAFSGFSMADTNNTTASNPPPNFNYMQKILPYRNYNIQKFISKLPKKERKKFLEQYNNSQQQLQQLQMQSIH